MELDLLRYSLRGIAAYKHLTDQPVMKLVLSMLDALNTGRGEDAVECYTRLFYTLHVEGYQDLSDWIYCALRFQDSPYANMVEQGREDTVLIKAARRDIAALAELANLDCNSVIKQIATCVSEEFISVLDGLPRWNGPTQFDFEGLTQFYQTNGAGIFAQYVAFLWESGELWPVDSPDSHGPDEMMGYERQRKQVIANTRSLLNGNLVNNILLYGDSGTGKSATVKSLLSLPGFENLRLIEVQKEELSEIPNLIRTLAHRRRKFILFIDDLAFDQDDATYSVLKTILEGGLERRPENVAIYATSNRRHLVRQTFSDRTGDEVDISETIQEKTSLAERFGLRIPYLAMSKSEYLNMVERMANYYNIIMEREQLHAEAVKWEMHHPGRTPRVVRQFIANLYLHREDK